VEHDELSGPAPEQWRLWVSATLRTGMSMILAAALLLTASAVPETAASDHEAECRAAAGDHEALYAFCALALDGRIDNARARIEEDPSLVSAVSEAGATIVHIAVLSSDPGLVELALDHGAPVDAGNRVGVTPLHMCAVSGSGEIAKLLLDRGARVEARDVDG
jgi:hypothetical protein